MSGLIGKKIGMTSLFDDKGKNMPCTVLEVGPCVVTQVRTPNIDGYEAVQLGFDDKTEKHVVKAETGHFKKANTNVKKKLVEFGVVNKKIIKEFGIKQEVLFADFDWSTLLSISGKKTMKVSNITKFPSVKRDLALMLDEKVTFKEIYDLAFQSERNLLKDVDLFDVYQGDKLPEGKKSYAVSFVLQDKNKTLEDRQIDKIMQKLQQSFEKNLKAVLR